MNALKEVLRERQEHGIKDDIGKTATNIGTQTDRLKLGEQELSELDSLQVNRLRDTYDDFSPELVKLMLEFGYADIFSRDNLLLGILNDFGIVSAFSKQLFSDKADIAICYDYDFPRLAMRNAKLGIGIVALPSSDWLGIDPIHTQMAALRAIEGGYSIIRSTRMGLSAGIDPHGRIRGWLSSNESPDRILWVSLPTVQLGTLYSKIHDLLVYVGIIFLLFARLYPLRSKRYSD